MARINRAVTAAGGHWGVSLVVLTLAAVLLAVAAATWQARAVAEGYQGWKPQVQLVQPRDMDAYLINLDRNPDRLAHFSQQYASTDLHALPFQRVTAVDDLALSDEQLAGITTEKAFQEIREVEHTGYRTKHYQLTRGGVGCYLSHMKLYQAIAASDRPYGLVFEDDVLLDARLLEGLNAALPSIPPDWDILLLSCMCLVCDPTMPTYYDTRKFFWLHCYLVRRDSARRILDHLQAKRIGMQIDSELGEMASAGLIRIYCLKDSLGRQSKQFRTTIQTPLKVVPGVNPFTTATTTS